RTLLRAVTRQIRTLDEGRQVGVRQLDLNAVILNRDDFAGHDITLLEAADGFGRIAGKLLDAERNALLLAVHVENNRPDDVTLLEVLDGFIASAIPVEVGKVNHAVHATIEADEQSELGDVADRALNFRATRMLGEEDFPRVVLGLLEAQRNATLVGIHLEDLDFHFLARGNDLAWMNVLLGPAHFGDVDQAL